MTKADHQRAKYKNLNKSLSNKKTSKEETFIIDGTLYSNSSSSSEADDSPDEYEKTSIAYNSESGDYEESGSSSIGSEDNI